MSDAMILKYLQVSVVNDRGSIHEAHCVPGSSMNDLCSIQHCFKVHIILFSCMYSVYMRTTAIQL